MKFVTKGVTRFVILIGNYAIKVPKPVIWNHFLRGLLSNMEESLIWTIANIPDSTLADCRGYLCPIVWSSWGGWIVIMKRVQPVNPDNWKPILKLKKICGDHKPDNYGILDGKMVIIDYGEIGSPGYSSDELL